MSSNVVGRKPKEIAEAANQARFVRAGSPSLEKMEMVPVMINLERGLFERINGMAREMGLNRTAFIVNAVSEKLRTLEASSWPATKAPDSPSR